MKRQMLLGLFVIVVALVLAFATRSFAGADWKEEQAKIFSQIAVKPGDVIDSSNWEKIKDLLPPSMVQWVKKGDLPMKIGEMKYDYDVDAEWKAATAKNEGKYDLDEGLEIRDKSTGKNPTYIYGEPFPNVDVEKDPNGPIKLAHNLIVARSRPGTIKIRIGVDWLGRETGFEKQLKFFTHELFFYAGPEGPRNNPSGYQYLQYTLVTEPSDVEGMLTLTKRYLDPRVDDFFAYVPAIRRVKRLSGSCRSDPFMGSDFTNDIESGWGGKNTSMKWKFLEKKTILIAVQEKDVEKPLQATKLPEGGWNIPGEGAEIFAAHEVPGSKAAPWIPVNVLWVPKQVYVLEATPKDAYYNWGRIVFYINPSVGFVYTIADDKSMSYWKTLVNIPMCVDWGEPKRRTFSSSSYYFVLDEKTQHGCSSYFLGKHHGDYYWHVYNDPTITEREFNESTIATRSR